MFNRKTAISFVIFMIGLYVAASAQAPDTLWTRTYGYPDRGNECWGAVGTPDGGLAMVGTTAELGYLSRLYVVRINSDGDTLWTRTFADASAGMAICMTPDNGFIVTGSIITIDAYPYIVKLDSSGNEVWSHIYTAWADGAFRSCQSIGNNGYILAGYAYTGEILLVSINSAGDSMWSKIYGGPQAERAWSAKSTSDGGFIVAGWTESFGNGGADFFIIKTDQNGDSVWTRTYGDWRNEEAREIMETPDGGFVFSGKRAYPEIEYEYYFMKINSQGDSLWAFTNTPGYLVAILHSFTHTADGSYATIGYTFNSIDIFKISDNGELNWSKSFIEHPVVHRWARAIVQSSDGSYFLCGNNYSDIWAVKLAPEITGIDERGIALPDNLTLHQNYPNPFNASTTISFSLAEPEYVTLSVYDLLGRKVQTLADGYFDAGDHSVIWNAEDHNTGMYFYQLKGGVISESNSMILLK